MRPLLLIFLPKFLTIWQKTLKFLITASKPFKADPLKKNFLISEKILSGKGSQIIKKTIWSQEVLDYAS